MHLTCTNMPVEKLKEALDKVGAGKCWRVGGCWRVGAGGRVKGSAGRCWQVPGSQHVIGVLA